MAELCHHGEITAGLLQTGNFTCG